MLKQRLSTGVLLVYPERVFLIAGEMEERDSEFSSVLLLASV